jgi:hypothetical protein
MHFQVLPLYLWDNWKPSPAEKWHWECMIMTWLQICWRVLKSISIMFSLNRCSYIGLFTSGTPAPFSSTSENDITLGNDNALTHYISNLFSGENTERESQHLHTKTSWPWFQKPRSNPLNMDEVSPDCIYASFFRNNVTPTKQTNESDFLQLTGNNFRV